MKVKGCDWEGQHVKGVKDRSYRILGAFSERYSIISLMIDSTSSIFFV